MLPHPTIAYSAAAALGGLILFVALGARQGFGLFMEPAVTSGVSNIADFSLVIATQYLVWGISAPVAGIFADRYGPWPVLFAGSLLYFSGFACAAVAHSTVTLWIGAGLLCGLGLGGASFGVVHSAVAMAIRLTCWQPTGASAENASKWLISTTSSLSSPYWRSRRAAGRRSSCVGANRRTSACGASQAGRWSSGAHLSRSLQGASRRDWSRGKPGSACLV